MHKKDIENRAFTLIELIIVVVILLALSGIAIGKYGNITEKARSAEAYAVLADIAAAESGYYVEYSAYATGGSGWAKLDRYTVAPVTNNFTYSLESNYGKAASTKGGNSYCLYFDGTKGGC